MIDFYCTMRRTNHSHPVNSNPQLIADQLAENGYFVMMPDLFNGDPVPLNRGGDFDIQKWKEGEYNKKKHGHLPPNIDPIIDAMLVEMRTKYNCEKIGAIGYCFGAKYVIRHLRPGEKKIDVGYCAHPSVSLSHLFSPYALLFVTFSSRTYTTKPLGIVRRRVRTPRHARSTIDRSGGNRPYLYRRETTQDRSHSQRDESNLSNQSVQWCRPRFRRSRRYEKPAAAVCKGDGIPAGAAVV